MRRDVGGLVFAMAFPSVMAWAYFVLLPATGGSRGVQAAFTAGKVVQFGFPLVWVWLAERRLPRPAPPRWRALLPGLGFGLAVSGGVVLVYRVLLRNTDLLAGAPARIQDKLRQFGLESVAAYVLFAAFLAVVHSLLEEYYWRWFVFSRLRRHLPTAAAIAVASAAFMAHHVIILAMFFPGRFAELVVPLSLGVAVGGAVWAWLYQRTGALYAPWLSHLLIDAAILAVGYDLAFPAGSR